MSRMHSRTSTPPRRAEISMLLVCVAVSGVAGLRVPNNLLLNQIDDVIFTIVPIGVIDRQYKL